MHGKVSDRPGGPGLYSVTVRSVASVPADAAVRDFDQLSPGATAAFLDLVGGGSRPSTDPDVRELRGGEIINFTGFYRVGVEE